ncbi:F-box/kelch-repeat protein [Dichanthelium oligosanthes]|uniref:F-box/kelch-repeat protein n=1 Tax=Dichanthelium oligosanthes TaxID=888268 RepID=A0A1E5VIE1_9POAL|nr:F-box/kelch-repeat protein [Dichanthelium oligosanthes]
MIPTPDTGDHTSTLGKQQEPAAGMLEPPPSSAMGGDLIPGLPEDLARECLVRLGFDQLPLARRVSRGWKAEVESPFHHSLRRPRALLALTQARPPLADSGPARKYAASAAGGHSYRLVLHDPAAVTWTPLPPLPCVRGDGGDGGGLPLFCQLAAVGEGPRTKLVVLGGWDPGTWAPTAAVHVYDFLTGLWRRGADMPAPRRSFFACAAVGGRVFVAGGHDEEKNALRCAAAYDAEADAWVALPDMARERDEARGVRAGAAFVALGGYPTEAQGRFAGSAEAFDPVTWSWGPVRERVIEDGACPRTCCSAPGAESGTMFMLHDGHVMARDIDDESGEWRTVARVPEDGRASATAAEVAAFGDGRVAIVGSACHGAEQAVYVLSHDETKATPSWTRAAAPPEFTGHVQAACCVQI